MPSYPPALAAALAAVDEDVFVRRSDGSLVAQSSSRSVIADLIGRLDVRSGMSVLEIGTGSGYSTALLAQIAGDGRVVSVDVVGELVERARTLLSSNGFTNTSIVQADGAQGASRHGPFDRIIAWATAQYLPEAWITQLAADGIIVAPIAMAAVSRSGMGTRIHLDDGAPRADQLFLAGFVEMHDQELDQWLVPPYGVDSLRNDHDGHPYWMSSSWLRSSEQRIHGDALLDSAMSQRHETAGPLRPDERADDFRAWLLATTPAGLTSAALGDAVWRMGYSDRSGTALTDGRTATRTVTVGRSMSPSVLRSWADKWRTAGRPGLGDLHPRLDPCDGGWMLRASVR